MLSLWTLVDFVLNVAWWVIVVHLVMSWLVSFNIVNLQSDFVRSLWSALERMTEPLYRPIRRILPDFGALDLSPMVVLLAIGLIRRLVSVQMVGAGTVV